MTSYVRYRAGVEQVPEDEAETFEGIRKAFVGEGETVAKKSGTFMRTSHAKATGLLTGELTVESGLPEELAQGLFARPGTYEALIRFAQGPGEILDDKISTHRGVGLKILGVGGERIPESRESGTQDWLLAPGPAFIHSTAKTFATDFRMGASKAGGLPDAVKNVVSKVALGTNTVLDAVGAKSKILEFFGHPSQHPLGENYFSQAPFRYGDHIAKLALVPSDGVLATLGDTKIDPDGDPDAFRTAMIDYYSRHDASFDVRIQLCTDLDTMPVENAATEWPQEESPYRTVATLKIPKQTAYSEGRHRFFDEKLAFSPAHSLAAHRPLGGIMRARLAVYAHMQDQRQRNNGVQPVEPRSTSEVPN